jgi:hypothetical protein
MEGQNIRRHAVAERVVGRGSGNRDSFLQTTEGGEDLTKLVVGPRWWTAAIKEVSWQAGLEPLLSLASSCDPRNCGEDTISPKSGRA